MVFSVLRTAAARSQIARHSLRWSGSHTCAGTASAERGGICADFNFPFARPIAEVPGLADAHGMLAVCSVDDRVRLPAFPVREVYRDTDSRLDSGPSVLGVPHRRGLYRHWAGGSGGEVRRAA